MTLNYGETNLDSSSTIHLLPEHLVDQIKAGEVIERPASLIKEILENSVDSMASQIDIHIISNGMDLISIIDNGQGMNFNDLPFAFCRHATSKIEKFEDLYRLNSYGFRGEALASIAAVSRITCTSSKENDSQYGGKIIFHGGECLAHDKQDNLPKGTSLFIKDLFYNTPVRLKFIKSTQSEKNAIKRILEASLLAHPHINFSIKWDDQDKEFYPACDLSEERVRQVLYSRNKFKKLISFNESYEGHRVWGYVSETSSRGNAHKKHYLFANKRIFTDRQIHQTIIRAMEGLYPQGETGHYCIFIDVPENLIDVNVHPNKTQIKFFKLPVITALISSELKKLTPSPQNQASLEPQNWSRGGEEVFYGDVSNSNGFLDRLNEGLPTQAFERHQEITMGDLLLLKEGDKTLLLSKKLFWKELSHHLLSAPRNQDQDFLPLLISDPLTIPILDNEDQKLVELEQSGFICERIDQNTLALRAIHNHLTTLKKPTLVIRSLLLGEEPGELNFETSSYMEIANKTELVKERFVLKIDEKFYERNF